MSDEEIEKIKEAIINIANDFYKIIKPVITKVLNEIKNFLDQVMYKYNKIKKE